MGVALLVWLALQGPVASSESAGALAAAVRAGDPHRVAALLRAGADPSRPDPTGMTPLMEAAQAGRADLVRLLAEAGAELDGRDRLGRTALDIALRSGARDIVAMLQGRGARGSGKSPGDTVCVKRWAGSGFCGVIDRVDGTRYRVRVARVDGCAAGCPADRECSDGEPVSESSTAGPLLWVRIWCFTTTYPGSAHFPARP
jgi:hypothetical protein